jgi:hypothetical protein
MRHFHTPSVSIMLRPLASLKTEDFASCTIRTSEILVVAIIFTVGEKEKCLLPN